MTDGAVTDVVGALTTRIDSCLRADGAAIVAVAGPVAVGKSTLAAELGDALRARQVRTAVVSTDGFLRPNAELAARGLAARKGYPESYDIEALHAVLSAARESSAFPLSIPVYSHDTYDIVAGAYVRVDPADVLVVEGVNALSSTAGLIDLGVYVDAPLPAVEQWFVERFVAMCRDAGPTSFYAQFRGLDADTIATMARDVYRAVNLPNLMEHIAPSRVLAHVVVEKRADHRVGAIHDRAGP